MDITISNSSDKPIYEQLFDQISAQIIKGELPPEFALPPIRTMAKELQVSVITVKKAWEELERLGFIYSVVGRGCFVARLTSVEIEEKKNSLVDTKMKKDVAYYKQLGLKKQDIIKAVERSYK